MIKHLLTLTILITTQAQAVLLDKVAGVINDKTYTLSEVKRVNKTVAIRKEIAPFIFRKDNFSELEILNLLQNSFVIKDKLSELGFVISDDAVESRIKATEANLKLNRAELLNFLDTKGISFNEYFELIRSAMEFNVFQRRIIAPLITITDQELKSFYYKLNTSNKALSFQYKVVDYVLPVDKVLKEDRKRLKDIFNTYRSTGNIPKIYSEFATNDLGDVSDEDLPKDLSSILRKTNEKSFSNLYIKGNQIHLFYVIKKELSASSDFLAKRNFLYQKIFQERSNKITANWLSRETLNYYVLKKI